MGELYTLLGHRVRVHLYTKNGVVIKAVEGRVADVARGVEVAPGMTKDLALVVDLPEDFKNSAGMEGEGWFAVQDIQLVDGTTFGPIN